MKIKLLVFSALILISGYAKAQTNSNVAVSVGVEASFSSANSIGGPGFSAKVELPIASRLNFMFSAGYFVNYFGTRYYLDTSPAICPTCSFPTEGPVKL